MVFSPEVANEITEGESGDGALDIGILQVIKRGQEIYLGH